MRICRRLLGAALLCGGLNSCASWDRDYWSFPATRALANYVEGSSSSTSTRRPRTRHAGNREGAIVGDEGMLALAACICLLPIAVDLVALPITGTHDLLFVD